MRRDIVEILHDERGNVLLVTILVMVGMVVIGTTLASLSSVDMKISGNQRLHAQALYAAEAGLNEAIHRVGLSSPTNVTVGPWTGNAAIVDAPPLDPNWEHRIYLTTPNAAPAGGGSVVTTGTLQNPGSSYIRYSAASGTDGVLSIRHKWDDLDNDGVRDANEIVLYDQKKIPPENFATGTPIEVITVRGSQGDATRAITAEVVRAVVAGTANTLGALYGNAQLQVKRNYGICGYNHNISVPVGTVPNACFAYHLGTGDLPGATGTGGASIQVTPPGTVTGSPTALDNNPKPFYTCYEVLGLTQTEFNTLLAAADHTSVSGSMHGISYFSGDCVIEQPVVGSGLLYVEKKIDLKNNLQWEGLIYAKEPIQITGATVWVKGSIVAGGEITWDPSSGTGVLFCAEAIWKIVNSPTSGAAVSVLSWQER